MDLESLFIPYKAISPSIKPAKKLNTSFLSEYLKDPMIKEESKDRAKRISLLAETLSEIPDYLFDSSWKSLDTAEATSDYTNAPESWKTYSKLLPLDLKNKAKKAREFFKKRLSLTKEQASGIVGVIISETGLDPTSYNKNEKQNKSYYGAGIGSWTFSDTKKRIKGLLLNIAGQDKGEIEKYTLDELLEAYALDLENHPKILSVLKQTTTVDDAADVVTRGIENGGMSGKLVTKEWFDKGYKWIKGNDLEGNTISNHYLAAMYNVDPKYAIGRAITSRITYSLI